MFLDSLHGDPIGFSVLGIFVIEKNTILTVRQSAVDVAILSIVFACAILLIRRYMLSPGVCLSV